MMKVLAPVVGLLICTSAVLADISSSETKRLSDATAVVREFRATPDRSIPENLWTSAECVSIVPSMKKAAFIVGGEFGKGVMSCRSGQNWSAPIFVELQKGSAGLQIGAEEVDLVLLMMNREGVDKLLTDQVTLGADAAIAAGPVGRTASASTDGRLSAAILAYSRSQGAFAGINLSGGVMRPDREADERAYGPSVTPRDVLFRNEIAVPAQAQAFVRTLREESRATTGAK